MRLLIAEDDPKLLKSLIHIFEKNKFMVDGVSNGEDALTLAQTEEYDGPDSEKKLSDVIKSVLSDKQRPGKEPVFTPEQIMLINELACKNPKDFGYELSCWNLASLAKEAVRQGIVGSISVASVQRFLKFAGIAPWKNRYWLNSPEKHDNPESFKKN